MRRAIIITISLVFSSQIFATDSVRLRDPVNLAVSALTNTTFSLIVDSPGGDSSTGATSEGSPAKIYVPMDGPANEIDYFLYKSTGGVTTLFDTSTTTNLIKFPLLINVSTTSKYLYAAVKDGASYKILKQHPDTFLNITNTEYEFNISPATICVQVPTECSSFAATSGTEKSLKLYFFLSATSGLALGTSFNTSDAGFSDGIYFEANMSNRINLVSQVSISIPNKKVGDRRLILTYSSTSSILKPRAIKVFDHGGLNPAGGLPLDSYTGSILTKDFPYLQSSDITINDLVNGGVGGAPYIFSVFAVDKYNFATTLSAPVNGTPLEIEELLKKEGCFLLTAGFGQEHFVIDYFRHFRDHVLAKFYWGRLFIGKYYELAPRYALQIYQSETLRIGIRGVAYILYFLFNYSIFIILTVFLSITYLRFHQSNPKKIPPKV